MGEKTLLSSAQLERKLNRLNYFPSSDYIYKNKEKGSYNLYFHDKESDWYKNGYNGLDFIFNEDYYYNSSNDNSWLFAEQIIKDKSKQNESRLNIFENDEDIYFDLKTKNKLNLPDFDEFVDGKYKMDKSMFGGFELMFYLHELLNHEGSFFYFDIELYYDELFGLNENNFPGLIFFENKEYFSIQLKISLKDYKNSDPKIVNLIKDLLELNDFDKIDKLEFEYIIVFKNNYMVHNYTSFKLIGKHEDFDIDIKYICIEELVNKTPKEIDYDSYEKLTEGINSIRK